MPESSCKQILRLKFFYRFCVLNDTPTYKYFWYIFHVLLLKELTKYIPLLRRPIARPITYRITGL